MARVENEEIVLVNLAGGKGLDGVREFGLARIEGGVERGLDGTVRI